MDQLHQQQPNAVLEGFDELLRSVDWMRTLVEVALEDDDSEISDDDDDLHTPTLLRDPSTGVTYRKMIIPPREERPGSISTGNEEWNCMLRAAHLYREHSALAGVIGIKDDQANCPDTVLVEHPVQSVTLREWVLFNDGGIEELRAQKMFVPMLKLMLDFSHHPVLDCRHIGFPHPDFFVAHLIILPDCKLQYCYQPISPNHHRGTVDSLFTMSPESAKGEVNCRTTQQWSWALGVLLYTLLTGDFPFTSKCFAELTRKITTANLDYTRLAIMNVSQEVQDLLRRVLVVDPDERLTLHDIWRHPWIHMDLEQHP